MIILEVYSALRELIEDNIIAVGALLALLLLVKVIWPQRPDNLPPGLYPWPIFGNLWELSKDTRENWPRLKEKYGDIVSVYMGNQLAVILNSYDVIHDALVKQGAIFSHRPDAFLFRTVLELKELNHSKLGAQGLQVVKFQVGNIKKYTLLTGIGSSSGKLWKEQRKFTVNVLRHFGLGKRSFEEKMVHEIQECIDDIHSYKGKPFDIHYLMNVFTSNVICSFVFGKRFCRDDMEFQAYFSCLRDVFNNSANTGILNALPWLIYLPGDITQYKRTIKNKTEIDRFLWKQMMENKASYDYTTEPQTFVEAYLKKIEEEKVQNSDTNFEEYQMLRIIFDLCFAGTDTTAVTIRWILLYLIIYPDMQAKVQKEVDVIVGKVRSPSMRDRSALSFTEAFISEVERCANIAPVAAVHSTSKDTNLRGYFIPKGTWILPNLHEALHDKTFWKDPENFRPSRFLDVRGKCSKPDQFIPFSAGKRICPGESLARGEVFLLVTSLLQSFKFRLPHGVSIPDVKGAVGLSLTPPPYEICAVPRT